MNDITDLTKFQFRNECRTVLKMFLVKFAVKLSLMFPLVKGITMSDTLK